MAGKSNIEWTDASWNCLAGCEAISPGCAHCYASTMTRRLEAMGQKDYAGLTTAKHFNGTVRCLPDKLDIPLRWRKPRMVFVNSMSDLFHEDVPDEFIDKVFAVMASSSQHTFQVLTKRPERMNAWFERVRERGPIHQNLYTSGLIDFYQRHDVDLTIPYQVPEKPTPELRFIYDSASGVDPHTRIEEHPHFQLAKNCGENHWREWPLSNVWLGISCEDQQCKDRLDWLRKTPAAVKFVSFEPLLEDLGTLDLAGIDWVIVGGESGAGARPCDVSWIRSIVQQCKTAGVACFVKQLGSRPQFSDPMRTAHASNRSKGGDPAEWPEDLRVRQFPVQESVDV